MRAAFSSRSTSSAPESPSSSRTMIRRLEQIRRVFQGLEGSHIWPFQCLIFHSQSPPDSRVEPEPPLEHGSDVQEVELRMDHDMVVAGARIIKSAGGIRGGAVPAAGHGSPWVAADAQGEFRCQDGV
ncbi:uncharacterized protein LOC119295812 isoform X1 [Triticum dicoccoides]|uniref:uncharacterized protein LOC119295812 isoform X1 n=1 Tax=Triticum dicoccoides TaxID=85692 RepID=UPI00188E96D0|nr:uncharacterized protein LOC119295812 isoform X1 [Triticum dicoccoides]